MLSAMKLSVLVPTYRRPRVLARCLDHLARQEDAPPFEVVVAIDGEEDYGEADLQGETGTRPFPLTALPAPHAGQAACLNRARRQARGELVVVIGDDIYPHPRFLARHAACHDRLNEPRTAVLGRTQWHPDRLPHPFMEWEARNGILFAYDQLPGNRHVDPVYLYGCNYSLHRDWLEELGGYDERVIAWSDTLFAYFAAQRGLRVFYEPDALGWHDDTWTLERVCERRYRKGKIAAWLLREEPGFADFVLIPQPSPWRTVRYTASRMMRPLAERLGWEPLTGWCWSHAINWSFTRGLIAGRRGEPEIP